jgi:hypothetical protein
MVHKGSEQNIYLSSQGFFDELQLMQRSLQQTGLVCMELDNLICQVEIFGFTLTQLDFRQESTRHAEAVEEIAAYLQILPKPYTQLTESERIAWLATELSTRRPLIPPDMPFSERTIETIETIDSIHVHCPEGSVPKDGPSAGAAITTVIYSLINKREINRLFAITGEISLDGSITEIGGLDIKILGGIKAGVKYFIFPKENSRDFDQFIEKYKGNKLLDDITFYQVETIVDVFDLIFVNSV